MCPCLLTPQTPALPLEIRVSLPGIDCHLAVIRTLPVLTPGEKCREHYVDFTIMAAYHGASKCDH